MPDVHLDGADLLYPENRAQPIAATLAMHSGETAVTADFDWRQEGPQSWDINIDTDQGKLSLSDGGATMSIDGDAHECGPEAEYPELYRRFAELVKARRSDVDIAPLQLVADAFLLGRRNVTEAFYDKKQ
ncbi:hypothetical protein [Qingshengfaniella alkalisoli]|uniref:hypothetical protein n=1 Tax=Qingshengfaniella alkalisoli TaxID=2599296 RepID=UPI003083F2F3